MTARRRQTNLCTSRVKEKKPRWARETFGRRLASIIIMVIITIITRVFKWVLGTSKGARLLYHQDYAQRSLFTRSLRGIIASRQRRIVYN